MLVYRCKDRLFSGWLLPVYLVDIVIYVCWQRKFVIFGQLSRISFVRNFSAGRLPRFVKRTAKPTAGNFQCSERRKQSAGHATRRNPQEAQTPATGQKPHGSGLAEVTKGRWSGWRLAAIVVAFPLRMAFSPGGGKIKQSILNITTHYAPDLPEWQGVRA